MTPLRHVTLAALATSLLALALAVTARAQTGDCPPSARVDLPACATGGYGSDSTNLWWYEVDNDCAEAITVKIDIIATWDDHIVVPARHRERRNRLQGEVRAIRCCTDDPDTNCYASAPEPEPEPETTTIAPPSGIELIAAVWTHQCQVHWELSAAHLDGECVSERIASHNDTPSNAKTWQCEIVALCGFGKRNADDTYERWIQRREILPLDDVSALHGCNASLRIGGC